MASSFSNILETSVEFSEFELDEGVDFFPIGDFGSITQTIGWGDGPWGDMPWGGTSTTILDSNPTIWTNIDTP
jgi:hypothetical protein